MQKLEMRDHISKALIEPIEVGLAFPSAPRTAFTSDGGVALDLVYQAAEAVRDIEVAHTKQNSTPELSLRWQLKNCGLQRSVFGISKQSNERPKPASKWQKKLLKLERSRVAAAENKLRQLEVRAGMTKPHAGAGAMIFAKRARRKIADIVTYLKSNVLSVAPSSGNSDYGRCDLGWTEILARADAELNDTQAGRRNQSLTNREHAALRV